MAQNNFVDIIPLGLTRGTSLQQAYILILREANGMRCMAVLISAEEYHIVSKIIQGERNEIIRAFRDTLDTFGIKLHCVVIHNNTPNRSFCSELLLKQGADIRYVRQPTGIGVALAMELKASLEVDEHYFDAVNKDAIGEDGLVQLSVPIQAMDTTLLEEALKEAVKNDQFEMARTLRDEIARRNASSHTSATHAL